MRLQLCILIVANFIHGDCSNLDRYKKIPRTDLAWLKPIVPRVGSCGSDHARPCNVTWLAEQCDSTPGCNAFNTNGYLKKCITFNNSRNAPGLCGCDSGSEYCFQVSPLADTYVLKGLPPPSDWLDSINAGKMLYAQPEPSICYMPEVGNGFLATVIGWNALYVGGLFNGHCGGVHKARLPSPVAVRLTGVENIVIASGLDLLNGVWKRRWQVTLSQQLYAVIEQRIYAHRSRKNVLVMELQQITPSNASIEIKLSSEWNPLNDTATGPGNSCAGRFTVDFKFSSPIMNSKPRKNNFTQINHSKFSKYAAYNAHTLTPGDQGEHFNVSVVTDPVPSILHMHSNMVYSFITVVASSLDFPNHNGSALEVASFAQKLYLDAFDAYTKGILFQEHSSAWKQLWKGIPVNVIPSSQDHISQALGHEVASHLNSSLYYILSSVRQDWPVGVSPGGLSTQNYQGAVFMDMDWWVAPAFLLLRPNIDIARVLLENRYLSLPETKKIAKIFNYEGAMYAWTAAYMGRPFSCCNGQGGYENCLEQHVTGDVAVSAWNYFLSSNDKEWLQSKGWAILQGVADFWLSRVDPSPYKHHHTKSSISYNVNGILPVDEWCVGSGCGCEKPGINNDLHTNAVAKLSLQYAVEAAKILGYSPEHIQLWAKVAEGIPLLFNSTRGHHNQFNSQTCPNGWGGTHYTARHTVCPEDVLLISFPLGDALNISKEVTQADVELFAPLTCKENAGMTAPIHTITYLMIDNQERAQASFNRSLRAACYGPFNVRNEVDKHLDIIGAHFDNTHFLTGDGGFLQALLYGYSGLRVTSIGLKLRRVYLPQGVALLEFGALHWHGNIFSLVVESQSMSFSLVKGNEFCLLDSKGMHQRIGIAGLTIKLNTFMFPGLLTSCPQ